MSKGGASDVDLRRIAGRWRTGLEAHGRARSCNPHPNSMRHSFSKRPRPGELRLDVSELTFVDSSGLGTILAHARSRNGAGPVVLVDPTAPVLRTFELMCLDQHPGIAVRRSS